MADEPALVRQWILLRLLAGRRYGATVKELAQEMNVCQKTIRRDLELFQEVGFPLAETAEDHGRKKWRLEGDRGGPGLSFAFDEALALYLARHLLEPLAGTPYWEAAQRAFRKIRAALGPAALQYVERFSRHFYQMAGGRSDYSHKGEILEQLSLGIEDCRAVFIAYQSLRATEPVTYDIYPYGLTLYRGSLYVVGHSPDHDESRLWKLDRITEAEVTEFRFQRPADFNLQEHFARSFGVMPGDGLVHVVVRFAPAVARYVQEKTWHASQRLHPCRDGSVLAHFELDGTEELKHWLLSFGRHAAVLEPATLREEMKKEVEDMLQAYYDGPRPAGRPGPGRDGAVRGEPNPEH